MIGFLNKLKILNAQGCSKLRSFPSIQLPFLELLGLSFCYRLKNFPEILGNMENIVGIKLVKTSIEELPDSFKNLTGLNNLRLHGFGMLLRLPSSILMMPKLSWIDVQGYHLLQNQSDKPSPMVSTDVQSLVHRKFNRTDESFPIILKWFANMTHLDLLKSNFTILPECLQEIRWFPPNLKCLSALNCKSSSSSCRNMLLNQELHEVGDIMFRLSGTSRIPESFKHQSTRQTISFWFHNKLPSIALFCTTGQKYNTNFASIFSIFQIFLNGIESALDCPSHPPYFTIEPDHTYLFCLPLQDMVRMDEVLLKSKWNHAVVRYDFSIMPFDLKESRMHIFKQESTMEDIQFTNPSKKKELEDDDDDDDDD